MMQYLSFLVYLLQRTTIIFEYNRTKYRMIIPAGADYTEMLEDEDYFYGYFYFAQKVGAKVETL